MRAALLAVGATAMILVPTFAPNEVVAGEEINTGAFEYLMRGMREERMRLTIGEFSAYGLYREVDPTHGNYEGKLELYCAFDFPKKLIRFDRSMPSPIAAKEINGKRVANNPSVGQIAYRKTKIVIGPKEILSSQENSKALIVLNSSQVEMVQGKPFDVRSLALFHWGDLERFISFEELQKVLADHKPKSLVRDQEGLWRIVWEMFGVERTLWVDEVNGFTPVRSETRIRIKNGKTVEWGPPRYISVVTWNRQEDVWVPTSFRLNNVPSTDNHMSFDVAFQWQTINGQLSDRLFDREGITGKERTLVVDRSTGKAIVVDVVNDDGNYAPWTETIASRSTVLLWIAAGNMLLLAMLIGFIVYRRRFSARNVQK